MSLPIEHSADEAARAACRRVAALPADAAIGSADIQALLAAAVRLYAGRVEDSERLDAFPPDGGITATEAMVTITAIMRAVNVQVFELGMWQAWSGR